MKFLNDCKHTHTEQKKEIHSQSFALENNNEKNVFIIKNYQLI